MKKILFGTPIIVLLSILLTIFMIMALGFAYNTLFGLRPGIVSNVQIDIGASARFTQAEIETAIDVIKKHFISAYRGCELLELSYNEALLNQSLERERVSVGSVGGFNMYEEGKNNVIVLRSNIYVSATAGSASGSLPGAAGFTSWYWILVRDAYSNNWQLVNWGSFI